VLAKTCEEWPKDWNETASFGKLASEQSWMENIETSPTIRVPSPPSRRNSLTLPSENDGSPVLESPVDLDDSYPTIEFSDFLVIPAPIDGNETIPIEPQLENLSRELGLPDSVLRPASLILSYSDSKFKRNQGTILSAIVMRAALFIACRQTGLAKTFKQFQSDLDFKCRNLFRRQFRRIDLLLKEASPQNHTASHPLSVEEFIQSMARTFSITDKIRETCMTVSRLQAVQTAFHAGSPSKTAAIILSFVVEKCDHFDISDERWAEVAGIHWIPISLGRRDLGEILDQNYPNVDILC
jgi:hypothetical protein